MPKKAEKKAPSVNVKKGDTVKVIAGRDKGAEGKVIQVLREEQRVIVEGVNRVKKHTKVVNQGGRAGTTGGMTTWRAATAARSRPRRTPPAASTSACTAGSPR